MIAIAVSRKKQRFSLWECWHKPPTDVTHLKVISRQVIGAMRAQPDKDVPALARALCLDVDRVSAVVQAIRTSKHSVILQVLADGLPIVGAVGLPIDSVVRCSQCMARLSEVPCIYCATCAVATATTWKIVSAVPDGKELPEPDRGTLFLPGSLGKMQVMQERLAKGFSAFSESDVI